VAAPVLSIPPAALAVVDLADRIHRRHGPERRHHHQSYRPDGPDAGITAMPAPPSEKPPTAVLRPRRAPPPGTIARSRWQERSAGLPSGAGCTAASSCWGHPTNNVLNHNFEVFRSNGYSLGSARMTVAKYAASGH
jgi:hypothetical protein